MEYFVTH